MCPHKSSRAAYTDAENRSFPPKGAPKKNHDGVYMNPTEPKRGSKPKEILVGQRRRPGEKEICDDTRSRGQKAMY